MAYVVTSDCHLCKFTDCVAVCPVDCFYELDNQLVINPDECIDCGACEPECPVTAIYADVDLPTKHVDAIDFNAQHFNSDNYLDNITEQQEPLPTAEDRAKELGAW
ncbi:MAG: indolepyruvate ferredoxin oxidoreductase subunit alpha [Aureispira sp.]